MWVYIYDDVHMFCTILVIQYDRIWLVKLCFWSKKDATIISKYVDNWLKYFQVLRDEDAWKFPQREMFNLKDLGIIVSRFWGLPFTTTQL